MYQEESNKESNKDQFVDRLETVLKGVPYTIWEQLAGFPVDKVSFHRLHIGGQLRVHIVHLHDDYPYDYISLSDMDLLCEPCETLLRHWNPFRELVAEMMEKYDHVMSLSPTNDQYEMTEKEFDARLQLLTNRINGDLGYNFCRYIDDFGLDPVLKRRCYNKERGTKAIEEVIRQEAFDIILAILKYAMTNDDDERVTGFMAEYGIEARTENEDQPSTLFKVRELADYFKLILEECEPEKREKEIATTLELFLSQHRSIRELYENADKIVERIFDDCNDREKEYWTDLGIDKELKNEAIKPKNADVDMYYWKGYCSGSFYGHVIVLYRIWRHEGMKEIMWKEDLSPTRKRLYSIIDNTKEEFWQEMNAPSEENSIRISEIINKESGKIHYEAKSEYGFLTAGHDRDDVMKKAKEMNKHEKQKRLIRRLVFQLGTERL